MKTVDTGQMGQGPQSSSSENVFAGGQKYRLTALAPGSLWCSPLLEARFEVVTKTWRRPLGASRLGRCTPQVSP